MATTVTNLGPCACCGVFPCTLENRGDVITCIHITATNSNVCGCPTLLIPDCVYAPYQTFTFYKNQLCAMPSFFFLSMCSICAITLAAQINKVDGVWTLQFFSGIDGTTSIPATSYTEFPFNLVFGPFNADMVGFSDPDCVWFGNFTDITVTLTEGACA